MFSGMPLLLMTTTGAKSGKKYVLPVAYTTHGDNYVVLASKGGAPDNPDWYHNLVAHPDITIELEDDTFRAQARLAKGDEREKLFAEHARQLPAFNDYKAKTTRVIPVFVLTRA
jgi:deazaflavin-dependent oxidoreductase (nitroreductase family)